MMWLWGIMSASNTVRRMVCGAWKDNNGVPCTIIPIPESDRKVIFSTEVEGLYDYRARDLMSLSDATKLYLRGHHKRTMQGMVWPPQGDVSTLASRGDTSDMWCWGKISGQTHKSDRKYNKKMGTSWATYCEEENLHIYNSPTIFGWVQ